MLRRVILSLLGVLAGLALTVAGPAVADTRVALVIANSAYQHVPRLPNPPNDARTMAAALRGVGFSVTEKNDLSKRDLEAALKVFAASAREADVAVIYYAGHGMEQGGLNYLVPTDATLASDQDVEFDAVPLDLLLRSVEGAERMKLVVLDACRNNPFLTTMRRSGGTRAVGRGLARVEPDADILVAYAAREGSTADDGDGKDSPFTAALAHRIANPGVEIRLLFGQVRDDVLKATERRQEPAIYGSLGGDPFYFVPPGGTAAAQAPPLQPTQVAQASPAPPPAVAPQGTGAPAGLRAKRRAVENGPSGAVPSAADHGSAAQPGMPRFQSGMAHMERQEWAAAVADFDAVIGQRPRNAPAYHNRARAKFGLGDFDGAIADDTAAIRLAPGNDENYIGRARAYRMKLAWDQALADNNAALAISGEADNWYQRGLTYEGMGEAAKALADYDKALSINPRMPRVAQARARAAKGR